MDKVKILIIAVSVLLLIGVGTFTFNAAQSEDPDHLLSQANDYFELEDYEASIHFYQDYLSVDPGHLEARLNLSKAYFMLERWDEGESTLLQGVRIKPRESAFYITLADMYFQREEIEKGIHITLDGQDAGRSSDFEPLVEEITERLSVQSTRSRLQLNYENSLALIWDEDTSLDMEVVWSLEDGEGEFIVDEEDRIFISPEKVGEVTIEGAIGSLVIIEDFEIAEQVLDELEVTPRSVNMSRGEEVSFTASGLDLAGKEMDVMPDWVLEKELGTLSEAEDGEFSFTAEKSGTETLTAEVDNVITEVTIVIDDDQVYVSYEVEGEGTVSLSPLKDGFPYGTEITLRATPAEGWEFSGWYGDVQTMTNPLSVTLEEDLAVTAVFTEVSFDLIVGVEGSGRVIQNALEYSTGDTVTLTAVPNSGWKFERWEGSVNGSEKSVSVTMNRNHNVQAIFSREQVEADESESENTESSNEETSMPSESSSGSDSSSGSHSGSGSSSGSHSGSGSSSGGTYGGNQGQQTATSAPTRYTLSTEVSGEGRIAKSNSKSNYSKGTAVSLTAEAASGYEFVRWEGSVSGSSPSITVTMDANKSVKAIFTKVTVSAPVSEFTLSTGSQGGGSVTVSPSGSTFQAGTGVSITAVPESGYTFGGWSGDHTGSSSSATITMDRNKSVTAIFEAIKESLDD
ncbi:InlB B-repeat-containing protein [Alteribacter aurantiacus]|uniref:InlB B-repeat-containing protein n=1 Tax=Alteribacter aurantiacus TaxID=254410 RepID=UPI0003F9F05E|nr:InlB B-repeat-containing protein [Alteribacter aurantiacus]